MRWALVAILGHAAIAHADAPAPTCSPAWDTLVRKATPSVRGIRKVKDGFARIAPTVDPACRVAMFRGFRDRYLDVLGQLTEDVRAIDDTPEAREPFEKEIAKIGLGVQGSEAGDFVAPRDDWFLRSVEKHLPIEWVEYLRLTTKEARAGFTEDASLQISWTELGVRVIEWEGFRARHPGFELMASHVDERLDTYLRVLLTGTDNSQVFTKAGRLEPEVRLVLSLYASNPSATKGEVVRGWLAILGEKGFRHTPKADAWLKSHGIATMQGIEPPTYNPL